MFTKMATIFKLFEKNGWKFDTTILNGMKTLWDNLEFIAIVGSEIWSVKQRYGWAGSGRFTWKIDFRDKNKTFLISIFFPQTDI